MVVILESRQAGQGSNGVIDGDYDDGYDSGSVNAVLLLVGNRLC